MIIIYTYSYITVKMSSSEIKTEIFEHKLLWKNGDSYHEYWQKTYILHLIQNIFSGVICHGSFSQEMFRLKHRKQEKEYQYDDEIPKECVNNASDVDLMIPNVATYDIIIKKLKEVYIVEDITLSSDIIYKYEKTKGIKTIRVKTTPSPIHFRIIFNIDFFIEDEFVKLNDIIPKPFFFIDLIQYNKKNFIFDIPRDFNSCSLSYKHKIQLFTENKVKKDPYSLLVIPYSASSFYCKYMKIFDSVDVTHHVLKTIRYYLKKKAKCGKYQLQNITILGKRKQVDLEYQYILCCKCTFSKNMFKKVMFAEDKDDNITYTCPTCKKSNKLYIFSFKHFIPSE